MTSKVHLVYDIVGTFFDIGYRMSGIRYHMVTYYVVLNIWKPDHLAHISIYWHILRYTLCIMSYMMLPYNSV
jgi:hypothetical protein